MVVNWILGGGEAFSNNYDNEKSATTADIMISGDDLSLRADGCVQGVQFKIKGSVSDYSLTDYYVSESKKLDNNTIQVVMIAETEKCISDLGSIAGDYTLEDVFMSSPTDAVKDIEILIVSDF